VTTDHGDDPTLDNDVETRLLAIFEERRATVRDVFSHAINPRGGNDIRKSRPVADSDLALARQLALINEEEALMLDIVRTQKTLTARLSGVEETQADDHEVLDMVVRNPASQAVAAMDSQVADVVRDQRRRRLPPPPPHLVEACQRPDTGGTVPVDVQHGGTVHHLRVTPRRTDPWEVMEYLEGGPEVG
jgi:hypothetical protein